MTVKEAIHEARSHSKSYSLQSRALRVLADEVDRLRAELTSQRELWAQNPAGVDRDADVHDPCPGDDMQWRSGIAIRAIDEALSLK